MTPEQRSFVEAQRVARLATADAAATPHVIPICYAVVDECFYFVVDEKPKRTRRGLKRLRNIAENAKVAIVIDEYADDWSRLAYLLVNGDAAIVDDRSEFARALAALRARYVPYRDMELRFESHPLVRITPTKVHFWRMT